MPYRRTEKVAFERLATRHEAILARSSRPRLRRAEWHAVQIAPVAARAGIAAGTVYRYFPWQDRYWCRR